MEQLNGAGLKDIFSTILKDHSKQGGARTLTLPPIIVLQGNGNVIAPGGTVHVVHTPIPAIEEDK